MKYVVYCGRCGKRHELAVEEFETCECGSMVLLEAPTDDGYLRSSTASEIVYNWPHEE